MKNRVIDMFLSNEPGNILIELQNLFSKYIQPIRPNRKVPRIKKLKRRSGKYKTLTNYKRAI
jgi:hypothetical protein